MITLKATARYTPWDPEDITLEVRESDHEGTMFHHVFVRMPLEERDPKVDHLLVDGYVISTRRIRDALGHRPLSWWMRWLQG